MEKNETYNSFEKNSKYIFYIGIIVFLIECFFSYYHRIILEKLEIIMFITYCLPFLVLELCMYINESKLLKKIKIDKNSAIKLSDISVFIIMYSFIYLFIEYILFRYIKQPNSITILIFIIDIIINICLIVFQFKIHKSIVKYRKNNKI